MLGDFVAAFNPPSNTGFTPNGVYHGVVKRINYAAKTVWVELPRIAPGFQFGPIASSSAALAKIGDNVICMFVEDRVDDFVVLGTTLSSSSPNTVLPAYCTSSTLPVDVPVGSLLPGTIRFQTDLEEAVVWSGSAWIALGGGAPGPTGPIGMGGNSFAMQFSTTTADADPGNGLIRFNHATYASVTQIFVDLLDTNGTDITAWLDALDDSTNAIKGFLHFYARSAPEKWVMFKLTAWTTATGYRKLTVTFVASAGTLTTTVGDTVIAFAPAGDVGATGTTGATGATGAGGATGATGTPGISGNSFPMQFSTTTVDADPGNGLIRLNNATYASVTQLYVDLLDGNGTDITAWLDALDDSTNTVKGFVHLYSRAAPQNWVNFKLTAWTTATGYRKLTVTFVATAGTLTTTAGDTILAFTPAGDVGATGATGPTGPSEDEVRATDGAASSIFFVGATTPTPIGAGDIWLETPAL